MIVFLLLSVYFLHIGSSQLKFTQSDTYTLIWSSEWELPSSESVSFWEPIADPAFYLLGDVVTTGLQEPLRATLLLSGTSTTDVARPLSSTEIWNNRGSVSGIEVSVHQLSAPYGYRCLGAVVVRGYNTDPDLDRYRCVLKKYVVRGTEERIWRDMTSSIFMRGEVHAMRGGGPHQPAPGLDCGHFQMNTSPSWVLNTKYLVMPPVQNQSHKESDTLKIWTFSTGKSVWFDDNANIAISNPPLDVRRNVALYSAGSSLQQPGSGHGTYLVSGQIGRVVDFPTDYTLVHAETAPIPLYLWQPHCKHNFLSLGLYATNINEKPVNETVCVHYRFTDSNTASWRLARWDSDWENVLWEAGNSPGLLNMNAFTYTPSLTQNPSEAPTLVKQTSVQLIKQNYLTNYKLSRVAVSPDIGIATCSLADTMVMENSTHSSTHNMDRASSTVLRVTSRWQLRDLMEPPDGTIPFTVDTVILPAAGGGAGGYHDYNRPDFQQYGDVIRQSGKKVTTVDEYFTFLYTNPDVVTSSNSNTEIWIDAKFLGYLTSLNEKDEVLSSTRVKGTINLIIRHVPLSQPGDE